MTKFDATERLIACVKCEIVAPLSHDWSQFKACLAKLRYGTQRALNAVSTELVIQNRTKQPQKAPLTYAYDVVKESCVQTDTPMSGAMKSCISRCAFQANQKYWSDIKRRISRTLPSFGRNSPVFVRADNWRLVVDTTLNDKGKPQLLYAIEMKLQPGKDSDTWFKVRVAFSGGSAHAIAKRLVTPGTDHKVGDLKLKWNERKRAWLALIAFSWPKPLVKHSGGMMAVHRGIRSLLYACFDDDKGRAVMDGGDIVAHKKQMLVRQKSLGRHRPELGQGAHGHGVRRREAALIRLRDNEERFAKTKMQQCAARMVEQAIEMNCSMIVIEDYGTIDDNAGDKYAERNGQRVEVQDRPDIPWIVKRWPWAAQRESAQWAASKAGLDVLAIPPEFNAQTCPECGHVEAKNDNGRGLFECQKCGYKRPVDYVTSLNMRNRAQKVLQNATVGDGKWAIVLVEPGKTVAQAKPYLQRNWLTEGLAQQALDDLLKPYPAEHGWRKRLKITERKLQIV